MRALLSDSIDDFLRFRRSQGMKKTTLNGDTSILKRFLTVARDAPGSRKAGCRTSVYCDQCGSDGGTERFVVGFPGVLRSAPARSRGSHERGVK